MQGVLPCSPGTVNAGAHNTVDAQRHGEPYRTGVIGAHNTVGENVGAYNTVLGSVMLGRSQSTVSAGAQGTDPYIVV